MRFFSRDERIIELVSGKSVLHLGCVGFADENVEERIKLARESLHFRLSKIAKVVGVDFCQEAISYFQKNGIFNNVIFGNVEKLDEIGTPIGPFDFIIAGDIIEHISNPGLMLEGLKRFCNNQTKIIITTPNSFGIFNSIRYIFNRFYEGQNHVLSFNYFNLSNLLIRHGYNIETIDFCHQKSPAEKTFLFRLGSALLRLFPKMGGTLFFSISISK